jgi:GT2 family glycosyltransferase
VLKTDYPNFEVLFVDNASTDGSVDFIKKKFGWNKRLRIIQNERNLGFAEGNNKGIKRAKGGYIALLNNDTKVDPQWLKELVKALQDSEIGAAQSKLLRMNDPKLLDCAGGFIDYYGYVYERGRMEEHVKFNNSDEIFWAKAAALIVKREVLKKVGLLDSEMFINYEGTDLCWRIWLSGYKIIFVPTSIVYHACGLTVSTLKHHIPLYHYTKNQTLGLLKNYGAKNLLKSMPVFLILELHLALRLIATSNTRNSFAIIKALMWNLFRLKNIWKKRQISQKLIRKVPDEKLMELILKPYPPFPLSFLFLGSYFKKMESWTDGEFMRERNNTGNIDKTRA